MKVYKYDSYEDYVEAQTRANVIKIKNIWVKEATVHKIKSLHGDAETILCHGTRNAAEQKYFKGVYPQAEVIGSEISHTAKDFPMTVQQDFHEPREEWIGKFDIIYSNSFDHSYDPEKSLSTWRDQLSPNGRMYIEHGYDEEVNVCKATDPLQIFHEELLELFESVGLTYESEFISEDSGCKTSRIYILRRT